MRFSAWTQLERQLGNGALGEIERSLRAKLRAHRLSESFIERCGDDAVQKGIVEYLRAREGGTEIRHPRWLCGAGRGAGDAPSRR